MATRLRPTAVALGSNQGDREEHLRYATARLNEFLTDLVVSDAVETMPEGVSASAQPKFLNAAAFGLSAESPGHLLARLHQIENERGRWRPFPGAARTLDLDLILVGELVIDTASLVLPHPRFRERRFVLRPLASIAPQLVDPVTRRTVGELLAHLDAGEAARWA